MKVHHSTLRKRLKEFGDTGASGLTVNEFLSPALDAVPSEAQPPVVKKRMADAAEKRIKTEVLRDRLDESNPDEDEGSVVIDPSKTASAFDEVSPIFAFLLIFLSFASFSDFFFVH